MLVIVNHFNHLKNSWSSIIDGLENLINFMVSTETIINVDSISCDSIWIVKLLIVDEKMIEVS